MTARDVVQERLRLMQEEEEKEIKPPCTWRRSRSFQPVVRRHTLQIPGENRKPVKAKHRDQSVTGANKDITFGPWVKKTLALFNQFFTPQPVP